MRFSIITICRNEEKRIQKTLESIYRQEYQDYEHIIEDGKSTDKTMDVVSKCSVMYPQDHLKVFSEKDEGLYDAMNRAVARAQGEYICFINSGDYLMNEKTLGDVAAQMDVFPGMDWYYGSCMVIFPNEDEYLQVHGSVENVDGADISEELKKGQISLVHQSVFAHRNCFVQNMFDTKYSLRAELKWYYKCLLARRKVKRMNFPVCKYALGGFSEKVASVAVNARETKDIFEEMHLLTEENADSLPREHNYSECCKTIYNQWLALRQAGVSVADYLKRKKVNRVAVYGYAEFGTHLINELKNSEIEIVCLIDQQDKIPYCGIKVLKPDEFDGNVDLVIVTALLHFGEIRDYLNGRVVCQVVSLEDVLEDMWEY